MIGKFFNELLIDGADLCLIVIILGAKRLNLLIEAF